MGRNNIGKIGWYVSSIQFFHSNNLFVQFSIDERKNVTKSWGKKLSHESNKPRNIIRAALRPFNQYQHLKNFSVKFLTAAIAYYRNYTILDHKMEPANRASGRLFFRIPYNNSCGFSTGRRACSLLECFPFGFAYLNAVQPCRSKRATSGSATRAIACARKRKTSRKGGRKERNERKRKLRVAERGVTKRRNERSYESQLCPARLPLLAGN